MTDYAAAFPQNPPLDGLGCSAAGYPYPETGLLMRDYFAARAMQAMISTAGAPCLLGLDKAAPNVASAAYKMADAMMHERSQPQPLPGEQAPESRAPDGYVYRYGDGFIRHSDGARINGGDPVEAIPYFYGSPQKLAGGTADETPPDRFQGHP